MPWLEMQQPRMQEGWMHQKPLRQDYLLRKFVQMEIKKTSYRTITGNEAVSYSSGGKEIARTVYTDKGVTVNIKESNSTYKVSSLAQADAIVSEWSS